MNTRGLVLDTARYWSKYGAAAPAVGLPDKSRWGNNGTFEGTVAWVQLPSGVWVVDFNLGANDYIHVANHPSLVFTNQDFSIECWTLANAYAGGDYHIIWYNGEWHVGGWTFLIQAAGSLWLQIHQAGASQEIISSVVFTLGTWQHIAATRSGATGRLFHNGVETGYAATPAIVDPVATAREGYIGAYDPITYHADGMIYPPRIYNRALTPDEINRHYAAERHWFEV